MKHSTRQLFAILIAAFVTVSASLSFAGTRDNFQACAAQDSSWMGRWGNYIVAFDHTSAYAVCNSSSFGSIVTVKRAGCYLSGRWATAGYYCEEVSPGGD